MASMDMLKKMKGAKEQGGYVCPFMEQCHFLLSNYETMPELVERTVEHYCTNSQARCARLELYESLGAAAVPELMLPNQYDWARQIVEDALDSSTVLPERRKS